MHFLKLKGKKENAAGPSQYSTGNTYYINKFSECVCFPPHPAYIIIKKIDPNKKENQMDDVEIMARKFCKSFEYVLNRFWHEWSESIEKWEYVSLLLPGK